MRKILSISMIAAFTYVLGCSAGGPASSTGGASSTTSSGGTTGGTTPINGCDPSTATDMTSQAAVTISFGGTVGFAYSPSCVRVKSGTVVTFQGDSFSTHPLVGGMATRSQATSDSASPIHASGSGGAFSFTATGSAPLPYYCANHFGSGMMGAILVSP